MINFLTITDFSILSDNEISDIFKQCKGELSNLRFIDENTMCFMTNLTTEVERRGLNENK